jgi:CRISPR-associated protein Cmr6
MQSRRKELDKMKYEQTTHAGLWLDKYIVSQEREDTETRKTLVKEVAAIQPPPYYKDFFEQWKAHLQTYGAIFREATVQGRMVIGLGNESVLETSVTLHRTYGVPVIPGSALKGLAASYARQHLGDAWKAGTEAYTTAFGNTDSAGYITFFDALYVPDTGQHNGKPLAPDVIAVHHPDYYRGNDAAPADWDSPNPIPFLAATGTYLLALAGEPQWVEAVFTILEHALADMGIGAKTSSGYGRMKLPQNTEQVGTPQQTVATDVDPEQAQAEKLLDRLAQLPINQVANQLNPLFKEWQELQIRTELKQQVAQAIVDKVQAAGRERNSANKAWYKELIACLEQEGEA